MTPMKFMPSGRNEVIVRVVSYEDQCPKGVLECARLDAPLPFSSLTQLLLMMEEIMDSAHYPQRSEEPRAFSKKELLRQPVDVPEPDQIAASFRVSVLFRQNASWQGSLLWIERAMDAQFRSVLEFVRLLDSALSSQEVAV